jgi:hypothetical protein
MSALALCRGWALAEHRASLLGMPFDPEEAHKP